MFLDPGFLNRGFARTDGKQGFEIVATAAFGWVCIPKCSHETFIARGCKMLRKSEGRAKHLHRGQNRRAQQRNLVEDELDEVLCLKE